MTARISFSVKFHLQHGADSISLVSLIPIKYLTFTSMKPVLQNKTIVYNTRIFVLPYGIDEL